MLGMLLAEHLQLGLQIVAYVVINKVVNPAAAHCLDGRLPALAAVFRTHEHQLAARLSGRRS